MSSRSPCWPLTSGSNTLDSTESQYQVKQFGNLKHSNSINVFNLSHRLMLCKGVSVSSAELPVCYSHCRLTSVCVCFHAVCACRFVYKFIYICKVYFVLFSKYLCMCISLRVCMLSMYVKTSVETLRCLHTVRRRGELAAGSSPGGAETQSGQNSRHDVFRGKKLLLFSW